MLPIFCLYDTHMFRRPLGRKEWRMEERSRDRVSCCLWSQARCKEIGKFYGVASLGKLVPFQTLNARWISFEAGRSGSKAAPSTYSNSWTTPNCWHIDSYKLAQYDDLVAFIYHLSMELAAAWVQAVAKCQSLTNSEFLTPEMNRCPLWSGGERHATVKSRQPEYFDLFFLLYWCNPILYLQE